MLGDVKSFQALLDHYMAATSLVEHEDRRRGRSNTGSFFLMPEDNLANLAAGQRDADRALTGKKSRRKHPRTSW